MGIAAIIYPIPRPQRDYDTTGAIETRSRDSR